MPLDLKSATYKLGAIFFLSWGLLHIYAAYLGYQLAEDAAPGLTQGKLYQGAWNLAYLSVFTIVIAVAFNWRNSLLGYWLNLFTISVTDIGFLVLIYVPGLSTDLLGPTLWILGVIFSTIGILTRPRTP